MVHSNTNFWAVALGAAFVGCTLNSVNAEDSQTSNVVVYSPLLIATNQTLVIASTWTGTDGCPLGADKVFNVNQCVAAPGSVYKQFVFDEDDKAIVLETYTDRRCKSPIASSTAVENNSCMTYKTHTVTTTKTAITSATVTVSASATPTHYVQEAPLPADGDAIVDASRLVRAFSYADSYVSNSTFNVYQMAGASDTTFMSSDIFPFVSHCSTYNGEYVLAQVNSKEGTVELNTYKDKACKKVKKNVISVPFTIDVHVDIVTEMDLLQDKVSQARFGTVVNNGSYYFKLANTGSASGNSSSSSSSTTGENDRDASTGYISGVNAASAGVRSGPAFLIATLASTMIIVASSVF